MFGVKNAAFQIRIEGTLPSKIAEDIKGFSYIFHEYLKMFGARQMGHF